MDVGLVIIRAVSGVVLAAHGAQKLLGWFGGHGVSGTAAYFHTLGIRPGSLMAGMAGVAELGGGLALGLGLLTPFAAALVLATMLVAIGSAHAGKGLFAANGGYELPLVVASVAAGLAFAGPGSLSIDHVLGLDLAGPKWGAVGVALAVAGALPPLLGRLAVTTQADR